MRKNLKLLFVLLAIVFVLLLIAPSNRLLSWAKGADTQNQDDDLKDMRGHYPAVDASQPEPADPKQRVERQKRNKKHNQKIRAIDPAVVLSAEGYHWPPDFPAIPTNLSDLVVIGKVTDAKAYLSEDKNTVYSEYTIKVDKILKGDNSRVTDGSLIAERRGGRVRYPEGQESWLYVVGQGAPHLGAKYILFLKATDDSNVFDILTGYEFHGNQIQPLDYSPGVVKFDRYTGWDVTSFINEIQNKLALNQ